MGGGRWIYKGFLTFAFIDPPVKPTDLEQNGRLVFPQVPGARCRVCCQLAAGPHSHPGGGDAGVSHQCVNYSEAMVSTLFCPVSSFRTFNGT